MNADVYYIWSDLHQELSRFIYAKVRDKAASDDILQDVFVKIYLNIDRLKDPGALVSWVYRITRHTIHDHFNRQRSADDPVMIDMAEEERGEDLYRSLSSCINGKIARLPERDREAVLLTYFRDCSQKDLAEFLGISYSGAKNRVQRAREKLRHAILDCENVESDADGKITEFTGDEG